MKKYMKLALFALVVILLWYFRTWFHGLVLFLWATPVIIQTGLITWLLHRFWFSRLKTLTKPRPVAVTGEGVTPSEHSLSLIWIVTPLVFLLLLVPGLIMANWARGVHLAENVEYSWRDSLPESDENIRLMPYEVAQRYAKDSLQLSQYKLGTENIAQVDGDLSWVFPLTPDGLVITFLRQNKGVVSINATTHSNSAGHTWQDMAVGEGMQIRDNLYWNILRNRYLVSTDDPYYITDGSDIYTVVAAIGYRFHFRWGVFYTSPYFAGVFLVNTAGDIEFISPQAALEHQVLAKNRVFPEKLTRTYVEAYQYHLGLLNKLFIHEDQIQIQDVKNPSAPTNRQPYLMNTQEGLKWFVSTEPYGASHGIFQIFVVDARTGEIEMYRLPSEETLTGPVRAADYVRRSNPVVDWSRFNSVEPLPFIREGNLYWKLTIIPDDAAGIAYQAFVDARDNQVTELRTEQEVLSFLQGNLDEREQSLDIFPQEQLVEKIRQKLEEVEKLLEQLQ